MKKIAMLNPYFGRLPNYFSLWLLSATHNPTIDFFIITDNSLDEMCSSNIHLIKMTFIELSERVKGIFGSDVCLKDPYKLTDYKPAYGIIFSEYIKGYDFWGYYDIDVILGDIRHFVSDDLLDKYDKLYKRGHFTLFKNDKYTNNLFLEKHHLDTYRFDEVCHTNYACHFDEIGICDIFDSKGIESYYSLDYADVLTDFNCFILYPENKYLPQIFRWNEGKLIRMYVENGKILAEENMYIHLQKRNMEIRLNRLNQVKSFLIVPNQFIEDIEELSVDCIIRFSERKFYPQKYKSQIKGFWNNLKKGAIKQRILRYIKRCSINKGKE